MSSLVLSDNLEVAAPRLYEIQLAACLRNTHYIQATQTIESVDLSRAVRTAGQPTWTFGIGDEREGIEKPYKVHLYAGGTHSPQLPM